MGTGSKPVLVVPGDLFLKLQQAEFKLHFRQM